MRVKFYTKVNAMPISDDETSEDVVKEVSFDVSALMPIASFNSPLVLDIVEPYGNEKIRCSAVAYVQFSVNTEGSYWVPCIGVLAIQGQIYPVNVGYDNSGITPFNVEEVTYMP